MLTVETRHAIDPATARGFDTDALRKHFHVGGIFVPGEIRLVYTHYDRMIVGGAVPEGAALTLDRVAEAGTPSLLDRRELVVVNIGGDGTVAAAGATHAMVKGDMLYLGMGSGLVTFAGAGRFYLLSAPAHATHPTRLIRIAEAATVTLGSAEASNARTIYQFVHPDVMKACQLVVGMTKLEPGSVWNTMPAHVHDRRMEAYLYIDLDENARAIHLMGEPTETRHLVLKNEEGAISPPWSVHAGAGTSAYAFIWAMAGDNVDYKDVEMVAMGDLKMSDPFRLDGKVALVTGANTGIGQAIAIGLARAGAEVVAAGRSSLDQTLDLITAEGLKGRPFQLALDEPAAAAQTLLTLGPVDILVNNAGIIRRADAVDFSEADWDDVIDVNLKAVFFLSQTFARAAFARGAGGAIVNIASLLAFQGGIRIPSYTAAKHGVAGLTKLFANEWAARGINVNAIAPGYIETNNTEALRADVERNKAILDRIPAGRWGEPEDIAGAAVFLASPAAKYVNGTILPVDGGWLAR